MWSLRSGQRPRHEKNERKVSQEEYVVMEGIPVPGSGESRRTRHRKDTYIFEAKVASMMCFEEDLKGMKSFTMHSKAFVDAA